MRFIVDESSLDCTGYDAEIVRNSLARLGEVLHQLREKERGDVGLLSGWGASQCWNGADVAQVLNSATVLERDVRVQLLGMLDKCVAADDEAQDCDPLVQVNEESPCQSYGISLAHHGAIMSTPQARAVISLALLNRHGPQAVRCGDRTVSIAFIVDVNEECLLWRQKYQLENVSEGDFFAVAEKAFPDLEFAPSLRFDRFVGSYAAVRPQVVSHLGAINDRWTEVYVEAAGNSEVISTRLGISVSRESGATRSSNTLMAERDVVMGEVTYRCEWHSKLEPHQNRIHFHPATDTLDKPLIGVFCDHLKT